MNIIPNSDLPVVEEGVDPVLVVGASAHLDLDHLGTKSLQSPVNIHSKTVEVSVSQVAKTEEQVAEGAQVAWLVDGSQGFPEVHCLAG